ncbi:hypothetical protein LTR36_008871 [Oleoguttula mirabilis]|uniref:PEBP-like protein n=1 Tax=Oleoguttula mirabilis TaxID=1507867 RepID=A0AAV9J8S8_9PEZI|nr:hypothetical protein LTR36_008871 [Oleoguttula mirabilis]
MCALAGLAVASPLLLATEGQQQPLVPALGRAAVASDLISELKAAEIIPNVIDAFTPLLTLSIAWENATAEVGNTIDPSKMQDAPNAPSRDNPKWSEICHWIATGVHLTHPDDEPQLSGFHTEAVEVMPYKPPGPPPKTGKHRYVFVALAPKNGTTEKLSLSKPGDRQHWGYEEKGVGLKRWAGENGLEVIGANFVYAQNRKQS